MMERRASRSGQQELPLPDEVLAAPVLVATPDAFQAMLVALAGEPALALDTESDSLYRYYYKVCLIQISTPTTDYLVDPLSLPDISQLGQIMANPAVQKVFHAAENDILVLKRDFGFQFAHIFDTMLAARILGWRRVGLAALLAEHFGVALDKRTQLTDWGRRPLSTEQLRYARLDSHYLLPLRDLQVRELQARRRWREAQEAFAALSHVEYVEKSFAPDGFWRVKGARELGPRELAVLRELYLWRDSQARALDRPPFRVLNDEMLVRLSRQQPRRLDELPLPRRQAARFGPAILAAIARGQVAPIPEPPSRRDDDRPDPLTLACFDQLRAWRARRAAERGVDSDLILTNEALMAIARRAPATLAELASLQVMGTWKLEEYGAEILQVVRGARRRG
jgi:ribonuclease D